MLLSSTLIRRSAQVGLLALGLSSCNVTDLAPQNALTETAIFGDAARISLAVTGVYDAAQSGFYDPLNGTGLAVRGYPFGAAANEQDDARGEDVVDMAGFFGLVFLNQIGTTSPNVVNMWSNCYALANQANVVIAGVRQAAAAGVIPATDAAVYEGELRFLRALAHHEVVLHFARPYTDNNGANPGVPYRDIPVNTAAGLLAASAVPRGTVADVYTKMIADLTFAEQNLPATRSGNLRATRATKGAAIALKQRLYLYQGKWTEAAAEGAKLISGQTAPFSAPTTGGAPAYTLAATPRAAFPGGLNLTLENIFSIENASTDNPGVNGSLAAVYGASATPANGGINGRALLAISPTLYNASFFTCGDLRRTTLMQRDPGRAPNFVYVTSKYTDAATNTDSAPIIRYAEVLLNQAEAVARTGNNTLGLELLNAVRNRAVTNAADRYAAGSLTGNALIQAILNERRIEFVAEGFRWDDISRLSGERTFSPLPNGGIPAKFNGQAGQLNQASYYACNGVGAVLPTPAVGSVAYAAPQFLWPIPAQEIVNNPAIGQGQQNPGY